jgi:hypothetical protein
VTLDSILRKYMAEEYPDTRLKADFKLYIDSDGDIVYLPEEGKYPDYIYASEDGQLPALIEFILNEAGIK